MTQQPYTHFDLPKQHLSEQSHYVPPAARNLAEVARRRQLPAGTLLKEQQLGGMVVARDVLATVNPGIDTAFASRMIGMAMLNTSWYIFGKDAPGVMRRRLLLPKASDEPVMTRSAAATRAKILEGLDTGIELAEQVVDQHKKRRVSHATARAFGRHIGNVSLLCAVLGDGQRTMTGPVFAVQEHARTEALELLDNSRQIFEITGDAHPSVAQLADTDSPLSVYWRRSAPDGAYTTLAAAQTDYV